MPADSGAPLTPDQRVRVFVSSTLQELAPERTAAREAVTRLRLTPVMFELGARPHPPRELYRAYLAQSDVFVGIYWRRYGWVAPGEPVSGLEDEYLLSGDRPKLIYVKAAEDREPRLEALLARVQADDRAAYKPFEQPAELADLLADDLAVLLTERFAAPRPAGSPGLRRPHLPVPPTGILGREAELATVTDLLARPGVRLVTLVGPGGIGKTRLALEVAAQQSVSGPYEGVWFVDLAPVADPDQVPGAIAAALGIRPEGSGPVLDLLADRLRDRPVLLVLDNFEQVLPAAADVAALLAACPSVRLLVTSRTALRLRAERELPLAALPTGAAVDLLVERARDARPGFDPDPAALAALGELARRLDGIPLALELAAARLRLLPPAQLLRRLGDRLDRPLDLAAGAVDLPHRQRTLRATIEWSYDLLAPAERALLDRLSVFTGTFTLAAAEAVAAAPGEDLLNTLSSLVAQSMVGPAGEDEGGDPRFGMLGTVQAYARERLEAGTERLATLGRLTAWLRSFAAAAGPALMGPDNRLWARRVDAELDDLRSMMRWAVATDDAETVVRLAAPLFPYWWSRGLLPSMRELADEAAALPSAAALPPDAAAQLLWARGMLRIATGDAAAAQPYLARLRDAAGTLGDVRLRAHALAGLGLAEAAPGAKADLDQLDEAVAAFREVGDDWGLAFALSARGQLALLSGDPATATSLHTEALAAADRIDSAHLRAQALDLLGADTAAAGDLAGAWSRFADASRVHAALMDQEGSAYCLDGFAGLALASGNAALAAELQGAAGHAREVVGVAVWPGMRPLAAALAAAVDATLGAGPAAQARARGARRRIPEALDWARDATRPPDDPTPAPAAGSGAAKEP
jgi:predicted ATPase